MFALTDCKNIACHGTSFQSLDDAINYANELYFTCNLCEEFSVWSYETRTEVFRFNFKLEE